MTLPSLPAAGSTSWYAWASGLHEEIATGRLSDSELRADFPQFDVAASIAKHARPAVVIADPGRLSWKPPTLISPTVVDVPTGFYSGTFGAQEDVILELPASTRISTISVTGGRNVVVIGGTNLLNSGTSGSSIMRFQSVSGHVFIEGVSIDANLGAATPNHHDAIDAYGDTAGPYVNVPDVTIENCRVVGVNGSSATNHADIYQPQGAIGRLRIDKLTGRSNYQGLFVPPQNPIGSRDLRRIDLGYEAGGDPVTYLLWLQDSNAAQSPVRTLLSEVYVEPRAGQTIPAQAVFPSTGEVDTSAKAIGALSFDGGASAYWPDEVATTGSAKTGPPTTGEFVPAGVAGFGYVSPGYLDEVPFTYRSAVLADSPALYLPLDGNSNDASGNGRNGTDTAITYTATGGGARQKGAGFASGSSSKISVPDAAPLRLSSGSFSIEFWTLITANVTGFPGVIKKGATDAATTGWQVYLASGSPGTPVFKRNNLSAQPPTNSMVLNKWQHWVFRFNATSNVWMWYLNGAKVSSGTQAGFNLANADTTALELGHGDSAFLSGTLDEVAAYNSVLTTDRIQAHYRGV